MAWMSDIDPSIPIFGDGFAELPTPAEISSKGLGSGYIPRDWLKNPYGAMPYTSPFPYPIIPRSEWADLIREGEEKKLFARYLLDMEPKIPAKNQRRSSTCWAQCAVRGAELEFRRQGYTWVDLSPGFVAGPPNNYRDIGGWPGDAIKWMAEHGVCLSTLHDPNDATRRASPEAIADAKRRKVLEWIDIGQRDFAQQMTLLLMGKAYPAGYGHMRHAMLAVAPVMLGRDLFGVVNMNSWGEENRFMVLSGSKAVADDAICPTVVSLIQ